VFHRPDLLQRLDGATDQTVRRIEARACSGVSAVHAWRAGPSRVGARQSHPRPVAHRLKA